MAALLLLAEGYVASHERHLSTAGPWDWQRAAQRADRDAPECDVLCFGDSQMKLGALPQVIEARTGRRAYNLALIGGQAPAATILLRRALKAGARPSTVLLSLMPPLLAAGIDRNDRQWPELLSLAETCELSWTEGDASLFARYALAGIVPSLRARPDIRAALLGAVHGQSTSKGQELPMHRRNWAFNRGAMLLPRYGDERDMPLWYAVNYPEPWACDPTNAAYLRRFLRLAEANGIRVYWLLAPLDPEAQDLSEAGGQDARFESFVRRALERHPNLHVLDGRHAGFDRLAFTDAVHLHAGGAYALSNALAGVLGPPGHTASAARWIPLPKFQIAPIDVPIEDINASMLAVQAAEERRR